MIRTLFLTFGCAAVSLACLVVLAPAAPAPRNINAGYAVPYALPFGVASVDGKIGYFLGETGGLEAVDLETGRALWNTSKAVQPLAVWDGKLVALTRGKDQPHHVRVLILDGDGEQTMSSEDIELTGYAGRFPGWCHARAFLDGNDLLLDWWLYCEQNGPEKKSELPALEIAGVTRVNLKTGKIATLDAAHKTALRPPLKWDKLDEPLKDLPKDTEYAFRANWSSGPKPLLDDNRVGVLWRTPIDKDEILTLRTWDAATGKAMQTTRLLRREDGCFMNQSADSRYLFLQHEHKGGADELYRYSWEVYRVANAKHLGSFVHNGYCLDAGVMGERAFVVEERPNPANPGAAPIRELFAHNLKTGKALWTRPAPEYRTAFPLCAK